MGVVSLKVLDVDVLQSGIDDTIKDIDNLQGQISAVQRAVRDFAGLDDALSGKGGEAIRSFYNDFHQPFLVFLLQSLTDYQHTLTEIKEAVDSFEPNANGYVSQEYLENDVKNGLEEVKTTTIDFTSEANSIIGSVQDIVSIEKIDESEVVDNVQRGKEKVDHIVEELNTLDEYGVSQLEQTKQDLDTMLNYLTEIESKFQSGDLSIRNFNVKAIQGLESFQTIQDSIYNKSQETILGLYGDDFEKLPMSEIEKMHANVLGDLVKDEKVILEQAFYALKNGEIDRKDYANLLKTIVYKDDKMDKKVESSIWDKIKGATATVGRTLKGAGLGIYDVGKDTVVGIYDMITDPEGTAESLYQAASHPIDTGKYIAQAISDSYKRDMINGDAESRAHWVTYALGTIVGTKGAGTATKAGVATTKTAAKNAGKHVRNMDVSNLFPYAPQHHFAPAGPVPYNVVDSRVLKDETISMAKKLSDSNSGTRIYNRKTMDHLFLGEINRRKKAVGYHHESMMGGRIIPGTETAPDKNGVYEANVIINGKKKKAPSSFFPKHWDRVDVLKAVKEAFENKRHIGGFKYEGTTSRGIDIQMYLDEDGIISTAFPIYKK